MSKEQLYLYLKKIQKTFLYLFIRRRLLFFIFIILVLIIYLIFGFRLNNINDGLKEIKDIKVTGKIERVYPKENRKKFNLVVKTKNTRILLNFYEPLSFKKEMFLFNKPVTFEANLDLPDKRRNPNIFNYRLYLKTKGIDYVSTLKTNELKIFDYENNFDFILAKIYSYKITFLHKLSTTLKKENYSVLSALLFSDKSEISDETYNSFKFNGLLHLLTTSGLHVGIIYMFILFLFGGRKSNKVLITTLIFLLIYTFLANFTVPLLRALIMISLHVFGRIIKRRYDLTSAASFAGILQLIFNPLSLFSASFILSYLSIFIVSFSIDFLRRFSFHTILKTIILSLVIPLFIIPITVYIFNYFSLSTFLIGLCLSLLCEYILSLGILLFIFSFLSESFFIEKIYSFLLYVQDFLLTWVNNISKFFSSLSFSHFDAVSPSIFILTAFYLSLFFLLSETFFGLYTLKKFKPIMFSFVSIFFVCLLFKVNSYFFINNSPVTFLDVGQGDALIIRTKDNRTIFFDSGGRPNTNLGESLLKPYLLKNGISKVDAMFITHEHMDHYKGALELKKVFPVKHIFTPRNFESAKELIINAGDGVEIKVFPPEHLNYDNSSTYVGSISRGGSESGDGSWYVSDGESRDGGWYGSDGESGDGSWNGGVSGGGGESENENTVLYLIKIAGIKILMTGDIDKDGENYFSSKYNLKCDILKVAHHGSKYSTSPDFLKRTNPKIAVIQVGKNNYGHPTIETLQMLKKFNLNIRRNDLEGAIIY